MTISSSQKRAKNRKGGLWVYETLILEIIFVTLSEDSSVVENYTQGPHEYFSQK